MLRAATIMHGYGELETSPSIRDGNEVTGRPETSAAMVQAAIRQ